MTIRTTTATLLFSTLLLASGSALAATQTTVGETSIERQLSETAGALTNGGSGAYGREETLSAGQNLQIARDLARQGQTGQAQAYLNIARGALGLTVGPSAAEVAGSEEAAFSSSAKPAQGGGWKAFSKDFYTPYGGL